jgi:hypothetical protein
VALKALVAQKARAAPPALKALVALKARAAQKAAVAPE